MQFYEVRAALKYQYYNSKESWEQTRMLAYITALVNSTKHLQITDIIKFPWENNNENGDREKSISNNDVLRLKERANNYLKQNK